MPPPPPAAGRQSVQVGPIVAAAADDAEGARGGVKVRGDGVHRAGVRLERGDGLVGHGRSGLIGPVRRGGSTAIGIGGRCWTRGGAVVFVVRHGLVAVLHLHLLELIGGTGIDEGRFGILWVVLLLLSGSRSFLLLLLLLHDEWYV